MTILKHGFRVICSVLLAGTLAVTALAPVYAAESDVAEAASYFPEPEEFTKEELIARIKQTNKEAKRITGYRSFYGRCSSMVNGSIIALGIHEAPNRGNGRDIYDRYKNLGRTNGGYDVVCYSAKEYGLKAALLAVSENGTRDVYNIAVGWQSGRSAASRRYGHACFIHAIVDGMVYFSESYGMNIGGKYYSECKPIVCTISQFADYYNNWARFEGLIHFDYVDDSAPNMTTPELRIASEEGFTMSFQATDNIGITDLYARVWRYGETEEDAVTIPVVRYNDAAAVRINAKDFEGFDGTYYVKCYAVDRKGNVTEVAAPEEGVSLYQIEPASGEYLVTRNYAGVHNAPYIWVNGMVTWESSLNIDTVVTVTGVIVNNDGQTWYLMDDGYWINGAYLEPVPEMEEETAEPEETAVWTSLNRAWERFIP